MHREKDLTVSYNVVSKSFLLLLFESLTEALDKPVQFLGVMTQELLGILQAPQTVRWRRTDLSQARFHLQGSGDAQNAVALLLIIVEGFLKQNWNHRWSWEARSQQDLPVLDVDFLYTTQNKVFHFWQQ